MIRKILEILNWLVIIAFLVITLGFATTRQGEITCKATYVTITNNSENKFVDSDDIIELLKNKSRKLIGTPIDQINLSWIEKAIMTHPAVKKANAWLTIDGRLHIDVEQRRPIIRIIRSNLESFYIDDQGKLMQLSEKYAARVLVANGNIIEPFIRYYKTRLPDDPGELYKCGIIQDLVFLACFIDHNTFWRSQIEQIYVNDRNEFELIPLVGKQTIILGSIDNFGKKFRYLKAVYDKGFSKTGWSIYNTINLKYENQVICTRTDAKPENPVDSIKVNILPQAGGKHK
ncbi:MAG: hypothetical protein NTW49_07420 [Bacteroidia bacterium]|nr:hypothetical protein [Bacteroidia bacterium]